MHKTTPLTILLTCLALSALPSCDGSAAATTASSERGYATGQVVDTRGNPVAGAKILLDNTVFYASYINGSTDQDGRYRIKVQPGAWKAEATLTTTYNGQTYTLPLHPDNVDGFDDEGAIRNFSWKLEGRRPGNDYTYYGGLIQLTDDFDFHDMGGVELTLTPSGPLIDDSDGRTLRLRPGDHYWVDRYLVEDIPIGRYIVRATLIGEGGPRPLRIQNWHARGDAVTDYQLDFQADSGHGQKNSASLVIGP